MEPVLCSIADAARMLGIGRTKLYSILDNDGPLETVSIGTRRLVKVASIARLVEAATLSEAA
jgi:hypothetical protein